MQNDETERVLVQIGHMLAEDDAYPLDGTLLYATVDPGLIGPAIFKDLGDHVLYRYPDLDRLCPLLLDLWYAQEGKDRWAAMEYVIRGGRFEVTYTYPDEMDPEELSVDRQTRIAERHYGGRLIVYPPLPDDDVPVYDL